MVGGITAGLSPHRLDCDTTLVVAFALSILTFAGLMNGPLLLGLTFVLGAILRPGTKGRDFRRNFCLRFSVSTLMLRKSALWNTSLHAPRLSRLCRSKRVPPVARPMLNGSERAENALKEVLSARSLGKRGKQQTFPANRPVRSRP